jgi:hypothetical protein
MTKLTKAQTALLRAMSNGDHISYSQDGDVGWLWPSNVRLETFSITDAELQDLRKQGFIGAPLNYDGDDDYRFRPPDVLRPAGRAALTTPEAST